MSRNYNVYLFNFMWIGCFIWFFSNLLDKQFALWGALGSFIGFCSIYIHKKWLSNDALSPLGVYHVAMLLSWYVPGTFLLEQYSKSESAMFYVFISHLSTEFSIILYKVQYRVPVPLPYKRREINFFRIHLLFFVGVLSLIASLVAIGIHDPFDVVTRMQEIRLFLASDGIYYIKTIMQSLVMFPVIYYGVLYAGKNLSASGLKNYPMLLIAVCLLAFPLGSRAMFIVPFIILLAAYNIERKPINMVFFLPLIPMIIMPLYIFVVIRTNYQNNAQTDWDNLMYLALDFSDPGLIFSSAAVSFFGRLAIIDNLADFLEKWDWEIDFFASVPQFLAQPIPRGLWSEKPYLFNMYATKFTEPDLFNMRISETIGIIAESLYNVGVFGVVLFSVIFGLIIGVLQNQYNKRRRNLFYQILYVQLFLWPTAWISEGLINSSANSLLILTIFINYLYWRFVAK